MNGNAWDNAINDVISAERWVRRPGLQGVVGRVPSRGDTFDIAYRKSRRRFETCLAGNWWPPGRFSSLFPKRGWLAPARLRGLVLAVLVMAVSGFWAGSLEVQSAADLPEVQYTNARVPAVPWSIHLVQVARTNTNYELHSIHAGQGVLGFSPLSVQVTTLPPECGTPVAGINGDFYRRNSVYAGHPRGLQIANGEVLSAPIGGVSFWLDALGQPHVGNVASRFQIIWPDGTTTPFGLNGQRQADEVQLYTAAVGPSTRTVGGRELVLERSETRPWVPLRIGRVYTANVRAIRPTGNTAISSDTVVLSLGPAIMDHLPKVETGARLRIATTTTPALMGVKTAISGGPVLVGAGRRQRLRETDADSYQSTSMFERHPRAAVGWNNDAFFLVEVDGRQRRLSVGMTLDELSAYLVELGCTDAMNLDGGGSATLWFNGLIRNRPCDGHERAIANCLVVTRKPVSVGTTNAAMGGQ